MENTVDETTADSVLEINDLRVLNEINKDMDDMEEDKKQQEVDHITISENSSSSVDTSVNPREVNENITTDDRLPSDKPKPPKKYMTQRMLLFEDARYFVVKTNYKSKIISAKASNTWPTEYWVKKKFNDSFRMCKNVILLFLHKNKFKGMARISKPGADVKSGVKIEDHEIIVSGMFKIDWVSKKIIRYPDISHLYNSSRGIRISNSGNVREIDENTGRRLCLMFPKDKSINLQYIVNKSNVQQRIMSKTRSRKRHQDNDRLANIPPNNYPINANFYRAPNPSTDYHYSQQSSFQYNYPDGSSVIRRSYEDVSFVPSRGSSLGQIPYTNTRPIERSYTESSYHNYYSTDRDRYGHHY